MFLLEDDSGIRVVTDPFAEGVGYRLPRVEAEVVLVSHDHFDHGNAAIVGGNPRVVREPGTRQVDGLSVEGFPTFHDPKGGAERGKNIIFRWRMKDITFLHLGDLGHALDEGLAGELKGPDVLFVPVGGTFTIDDAQAAEVVRTLAPRIAIPMHFRNSACNFPILTEEPFLARFQQVERVGKNPVYLSREDLPEPTLILVMDFLA